MQSLEEFGAERLELFQRRLIAVRQDTPDHPINHLDLLLPGSAISAFAQPSQVKHLLPTLAQ